MKRRASSETEEMGTVCHVEDTKITCAVLLWGGEPWLEWRVQHPPPPTRQLPESTTGPNSLFIAQSRGGGAQRGKRAEW